MIQKNLSDLFGRNWLNVKVKFDDAEIGLSYKRVQMLSCWLCQFSVLWLLIRIFPAGDLINIFPSPQGNSLIVGGGCLCVNASYYLQKS